MDLDCKTTAGRSYDYNLPQTYRGTSTTSISCYKTLDNYGACKAGQIVPPTPVTMKPEIFQCRTPHSFKPAISNKSVPDHCEFKGNRQYNNATGNGPYGSVGANTNTQETYRKISISDDSLNCGGLGCGYIENHFKPGFNDTSKYSRPQYYLN